MSLVFSEDMRSVFMLAEYVICGPNLLSFAYSQANPNIRVKVKFKKILKNHWHHILLPI